MIIYDSNLLKKNRNIVVGAQFIEKMDSEPFEREILTNQDSNVFEACYASYEISSGQQDLANLDDSYFDAEQMTEPQSSQFEKTAPRSCSITHGKPNPQSRRSTLALKHGTRPQVVHRSRYSTRWTRVFERLVQPKIMSSR
jgi:hypothetical protein